ncbi:MAG: DegT/DnrJ/EryC1/StrS family aminotransferase [Gammaproteobacteria bacterium]|nr:DegT/DnrJ/EryC1/StrS family aminotransferase [Gammaproteobacteria bacterium]
MSTATEIKLSVPFVDFKQRYALYRNEILPAVDEVFSSGNYILGPYVEELEKSLSQYLDCPYVLGINDGTTALILALKVLNIGPGDEVIVPVNSFIASAGAVVAVGATPVFCDVCDDLNIDTDQIVNHITVKTKAIMPVHLTGRPASMPAIMDIARKHNLFVIEDAAQSIGAKFENQMTGTIGDIACFSLHPLKNLYAYGDAGIMAVKNKDHYEKLKLLRNHGLADRDTCVTWGINARIDSLQAKLVSIGLTHLDAWNAARRKNAFNYQSTLKKYVRVPTETKNIFSVYHNFVILTDKRDALVHYLREQGVDTRVHYPIPLHLQPAAKSLNYKMGDFPVAERLAAEMLSLPIYAELTDEAVGYVIAKIQEFFDGK